MGEYRVTSVAPPKIRQIICESFEFDVCRIGFCCCWLHVSSVVAAIGCSLRFPSRTHVSACRIDEHVSHNYAPLHWGQRQPRYNCRSSLKGDRTGERAIECGDNRSGLHGLRCVRRLCRTRPHVPALREGNVRLLRRRASLHQSCSQSAEREGCLELIAPLIAQKGETARWPVIGRGGFQAGRLGRLMAQVQRVRVRPLHLFPGPLFPGPMAHQRLRRARPGACPPRNQG